MRRGAPGRHTRRRCAAGTALEYSTYPGEDHLGLVAGDSPLIPDLLGRTQARLDGRPAPNC